MKSIVATFVIVGLMLWTDKVIAQQNAVTIFRGLSIGMTRADVAKFDPDEFSVKFEQADEKNNPCLGSKEASCQMANSLGLFKQSNKATFKSKQENRVCASVVFDKDDKVELIELEKCFFGASEYPFEQFAQAVVDNYGIAKLNCKSDLDDPLTRKYAKEGIVPSNPRSCIGFTKTGEKVLITTGGMLNSDMTVSRPKETPKFN